MALPFLDKPNRTVQIWETPGSVNQKWTDRYDNERLEKPDRTVYVSVTLYVIGEQKMAKSVRVRSKQCG
jgi:hypothetical protein